MVAVGAVVRDDNGRILLVKHRPERGGYWKGKWICPGGRLEEGETIEEGILREVSEETHLDIKLERGLIPFDRVVRGRGGEVELQVIYIDYTARVTGGNLKPDDDVAEGVWMTVEEIKNRWQELHPDTQRLMGIAGIV